jgi:hypothetical protein
MPYNPVDDLRQEIADGHVLVVVGTGEFGENFEG